MCVALIPCPCRFGRCFSRSLLLCRSEGRAAKASSRHELWQNLNFGYWVVRIWVFAAGLMNTMSPCLVYFKEHFMGYD